MRNYQLIKMLSVMDEKAVKGYRRYMKRHHGGREQLMFLLKQLLTFYPDFEGKYFNRTYLYRKAFKIKRGKEWDTLKQKEKTRFNNLMTHLRKFLEDYIVELSLNENPNIKDFLVTEYFKVKDDAQVYQKLARRSQKNMTDQRGLWWRYFKWKQMENQYLDMPGVSRFKMESLLELMDYSKSAFQSNILPYYIELLYAQKMTSFEFLEEGRIKYEALISDFEPIEIEDQLYMLQLQATISEKAVDFEILYRQFVQHKDSLDQQDKLQLLVNMLNFISIRSKKGDLGLLPYYYDLVKVLIDDNISAFHGRLSPIRLLNVANALANMREVKQAYSFIEEYSIYIDEDKREEIISAAKALVAFTTEKYDEVLSLTRTYTPKNPKIEMLVKSIVVVSCFQLYNDSVTGQDFILAQINNFSKFLKKSNVSVGSKKAYVNLNKVLFLLINGRIRDAVQFYCNSDMIANHKWVEKYLTVKHHSIYNRYMVNSDTKAKF